MPFYKWGYVRTTPPNNAGYPILPMARIFFITSNFSRSIDGRRWKSKLTPGDCWGWDSLVPRRVDSLAGDLKFALYMKSISRNLQRTWLLLRLGFLSNLHQELVSYKPTKRWYRMTMNIYLCFIVFPHFWHSLSTRTLPSSSNFSASKRSALDPPNGGHSSMRRPPPERQRSAGRRRWVTSHWWCFSWENHAKCCQWLLELYILYIYYLFVASFSKCNFYLMFVV